MANYMNNLLPEYRKRPALIVQEIYNRTIEQILENADEKILVPPTQESENREIRVQINRDPRLKKTQQNQSDNGM